MPIHGAYLADTIRTFRNYKGLGDRAMAQTADADLVGVIDAEANSIATLVWHLSGNLRSRFSDFLTSDGEKPDRDRDGEFEARHVSRDDILREWEAGWTVVLGALDALSPDDLERTVHIRGEAFLVIEALNRSATHLAYHVGQMVLLAKHFAGANWTSLSIPKGQSKTHAVGQFKQGFVPPKS